MWHQSTSKVLQCVTQHGLISRTDLATCTNLSKAAITTITRELIDEGILQERTTDAGSGRGRPPVLLGFNRAYGAFVGVRLDEDPVQLTLTDFVQTPLAERSFPLVTDPNELVQLIAREVHTLAEETGARILRIGVAVSGVVDHTRNRVRHSANLGWRDVHLGDLLEQASGMLVTVENDANAVAASEKLSGDGRTLSDFVVVTLGRGIGGAHFLGGELQRGTAGAAGEIAHCTIDTQGAVCLCGKRGCLDTLASTQAIVQTAQHAGLDVRHVHDVEELAATGTQAALHILHTAGTALGLALSHVANLLDPGTIVVTGHRAHLGPQLLAAARRGFEQNTLPRLLATTRLRFKPTEEDMWTRGAAALAAQTFLATGVRTLEGDHS